MIRIVLLSGGLDSATAVALSVSQGWETHCLTVDYGQMHSLEIRKAEIIAERLGASKHHSATVILPMMKTGMLGEDMPTRTLEEIRAAEISSAFMPGRNSMLISLALTLSDEVQAREIWIGCNADDATFPDCSPDFIAAMGRIARLSSSSKPRICAPFLRSSKADVARRSIEFGLVGPELTVSCFRPLPAPPHHCGVCDACIVRFNAFKEAGVIDPTEYRV